MPKLSQSPCYDCKDRTYGLSCKKTCTNQKLIDYEERKRKIREAKELENMINDVVRCGALRRSKAKK